MVILLAGSSDLGRSAIARAVTVDRPQWRHLPLENLTEAVRLQQIDLSEDESVLARIASHCAQELFEDGFNLILSLPTTEHVPALREELQQGCLTVLLGDDEGADADCVIDTAVQTVKDSAKIIEGLIKASQKDV
jgi:hypothetical protein